MAYVRTVRTASDAITVQIVHSSRRGSRSIEHVGSGHDEAEVEALKAAARQRMAAGGGELDLGLAAAVRSGGPLEIASSRMGQLWDALCRAYHALGFDAAAGGDEVFRALVLARIIEPTSRLDSLRVLAEVGVEAPSYRTLLRHLADDAKDAHRCALQRRARLTRVWGRRRCWYDVTTRVQPRLRPQCETIATSARWISSSPKT